MLTFERFIRSMAMFGVVYAWLALQPTIEKHLLFLFIAVANCIWGDTATIFAALVLGDFIFGSIWLRWLYLNR